MLTSGALPGRIREVLIGHTRVCSLTKQDLVGCFCALQSFIDKHCYDRVTIEASARAEVTAYISAMPFFLSRWAVPWKAPLMTAVASLEGYGVCTRNLEAERVAEHGRLTERSDAVVGLPGRLISCARVWRPAPTDSGDPLGHPGSA